MLSSARADDKRIPDRAGQAEKGSQECMVIHCSGKEGSCRFSGRERLIRQIMAVKIAMFRLTGIERKRKRVRYFELLNQINEIVQVFLDSFRQTEQSLWMRELATRALFHKISL